MSSEARMLGLIDDAVRRETEPLKRAVEELSARLAAVEGSGGPSDAPAQKRAAGGRTARAKAQPADDAKSATELANPQAADGVPTQRKGNGE